MESRSLTAPIRPRQCCRVLKGPRGRRGHKDRPGQLARKGHKVRRALLAHLWARSRHAQAPKQAARPAVAAMLSNRCRSRAAAPVK
jgi:hypothetical protein